MAELDWEAPLDCVVALELEELAELCTTLLGIGVSDVSKYLQQRLA